ncbi:MAG: DUF1566 domain-containing protein [Treponema sp.]|jgi:hypothetical protein|nr:DUF1566 domain-containing protein [Treponema sp.]
MNQRSDRLQVSGEGIGAVACGWQSVAGTNASTGQSLSHLAGAVKTKEILYEKALKRGFFCALVEVVLLCAVLVACGRDSAPVSAQSAALVQAAKTLAVASVVKDVYAIGDTGPAGGLIFYDKGNNSDGWRFMEAAPADIRGTLYPSAKLPAMTEDIGINTGSSVGQGRTNTQAIMKEAYNRGGGFGWAAQACDALAVNGFDDWFLPSMEELNLIYSNLYLQRLGSFVNGRYWSSTYYGLATNYSFNPFEVHNYRLVNFFDGVRSWARYHIPYCVRAVRQF